MIPGNDDAIRSCTSSIKAIADGIEAGKKKVSENELKARKAEAAAVAAQAAEVAEPKPQAAPEVPTPRLSEPELPEPAAAPEAPRARGGGRRGGNRVTEISAAMVKQLRDATSAGMMDCKRALQETEGDFDEAVKLLRERGMASAAKRADRETSEGKVGVMVRDAVGAIVAIGCETEPVSNNDEFLGYAEDVLKAVFADGDEPPQRSRSAVLR